MLLALALTAAWLALAAALGVLIGRALRHADTPLGYDRGDGYASRTDLMDATAPVNAP